MVSTDAAAFCSNDQLPCLKRIHSGLQSFTTIRACFTAGSSTAKRRGIRLKYLGNMATLLYRTKCRVIHGTLGPSKCLVEHKGVQTQHDITDQARIFTVGRRTTDQIFPI